MKDWKIIIGLILVIIVLLVSLGFKVMNNTPENQMQETYSNYEETEDKTIITFDEDNINMNFLDESEDNKQEKSSWLDDFLSTPLGLLIGLFAILLIIIGNIKLYIKLDISSNLIEKYKKLIWALVITYVLFILATSAYLFIFIEILGITLIVEMLTFFVLLIILEYNLYHAIDTSFWFFLLNLIPYVGTIILNIIIGIRLANKFEKEFIFKIGLCAFPSVFRPILGFIK